MTPALAKVLMMKDVEKRIEFIDAPSALFTFLFKGRPYQIPHKIVTVRKDHVQEVDSDAGQTSLELHSIAEEERKGI